MYIAAASKYMLPCGYIFLTSAGLKPVIQYFLCLAGVGEPVETEHARTATSTSPKQQPFKTECKQLRQHTTTLSRCLVH